jgi:hypothetical protein
MEFELQINLHADFQEMQASKIFSLPSLTNLFRNLSKVSNHIEQFVLDNSQFDLAQASLFKAAIVKSV